MKKSKLVRSTSMIMAVMMVALTFFSTFVMPAGAAFSLQHIEEIKDSKQNYGTSYKIVEIAPTADSGNMGYYVDGQEPGDISGWNSRIADIQLASERTAYVNNIIDSLKNTGLMSTAEDGAPLHLSDTYEEHYPWAGYTVTSSVTKLDLEQTEAFKVKGKIQEMPDSTGGDYKLNYSYKLAKAAGYTTVLKGTNWIKTIPESSTVTKDETAGTVTLTSGSSKVSTRSSFSSDTFDDNTTYIIKFRVTFDETKTTNSWTQGYLQTYVNGGTYYPTYFKTDGVYEYALTTDCTWMESLGFDFFIDSPNTCCTISDISVSTYSSIDTNAKYVQDIQYFEYGEAEPEYGDNLFDLSEFSNNSKSFKLCANTIGDGVAADSATASVSVSDDGTGDAKIYTAYGAGQNYYFINVDPNTTYRVSFTSATKEEDQQGQFSVIACSSGAVYKEDNSGATLTTKDGTKNWAINLNGKAGTYEETFTTSSDTLYLQVSLGTYTSGSYVTFSDIAIQEVESQTDYYYNVTATKYNSNMKDADGKSVLPDDNTALYTLDSDGHYKYLGIYVKGGTDVRMLNGVDYYSLEIADDCWPTDTYSTSQPYRAISLGFEEADYIYNSDNTLIVGKEKAYFIRQNESLTYVGDGTGDANLILPTSSSDLTAYDDITILSDIVYYTGGYENNNWFKRRVLDIDSTDETEYNFPITVTTLTPDSTNLEIALASADLIVITGGIDIYHSTDSNDYNALYTKTVTNTDGSTSKIVNDIPDSTIDSVISTVSDYVTNRNMPIVIDTAVYTSSDTPANLLKLCKSVTDTTVGKVNGSIYTFKGSDIGTGVTYLANNQFLTEFNSDYKTSGTAYYPIYEELQNEQDYRDLKSITDLTEDQTKINEAAAIRYVINYKNQRFYQSLNALKVLEIQPVTTKSDLTAADINALLPEDNQFDEDEINIVTMSVAEFVGKNENFEEEYDMVYIGASTDNLNYIKDNTTEFPYIYVNDEGTYSSATGTLSDETYQNLVAKGKTRSLKIGDPIYNDGNLDGYYYTNVGDKITLTTHSTFNVGEGISYPPLSGLLLEDYVSIGDLFDSTSIDLGLFDVSLSSLNSLASSLTGLDTYTHYWVNGGKATFRTTGTDINQDALDKLQDFVDAGRPVIIDDKLIIKETDRLDLTATADISITKASDSEYTFNLSCELEKGTDQSWPSDATFSYQWYYKANGSSTPVPASDVSSDGTYAKSITKGSSSSSQEGLGTYYCEVSVIYNGTYTVTSNTINVKLDTNRYDYSLTRQWNRSKKILWSTTNYYNYYLTQNNKLPTDWSFGYNWYYHKNLGLIDYDESTSSTYDDKDEDYEIYLDLTLNGPSDNTSVGYIEKSSLNSNDDLSTTYYCTIGKFSTTVNSDNQPTMISTQTALNTNKIDNCSYMYQFLINNYYRDQSTKNGADNMFGYTEGVDDTSKLTKSLKIAKPELEFTSQPKEYPSQLSGHSLDFDFYIRDNSNPNHESTYSAYLYLDLNGDGKFSDYEKQVGQKKTGLTISTDKENHLWHISIPTNDMSGIIPWRIEVVEDVDVNTTYQGTASYEGYSYIKPSSDQTKTIKAIMILPGAWSHDYKNIAEMVANKDSIVVDGNTYTFKDFVTDSSYFGADTYIGNIFESPVFDNLKDDNGNVIVTRLTNEELGVSEDGTGTDELYHMGFNVNNGDIKIDIAITNIHAINQIFTEDADSTFFNTYDMMIMGFGDNWGNTTSTWNEGLISAATGGTTNLIDNTIPEGFEIESAEAVCQYINEGHQTLFCHDTLNKNVNFVNLIWDKIKKLGTKLLGYSSTVYNALVKFLGNFGLDTTKYTASVSDDSYKDSRVKNGYWNNLIMRDTLGLDRYGITYAIKKRGETIDAGKDTYSNNTSYTGLGKYSDEVLGRAHMYEYIYNYEFDQEDLSVESMLEKDFSVSYVPGTAETYTRPTNSNEYAITVTDRPLASGESVITSYANGTVQLVAKSIKAGSMQFIYDTDNLPTIYDRNNNQYDSDDYYISDDNEVCKEYWGRSWLHWLKGDTQIGSLYLASDKSLHDSSGTVYITEDKNTDYAYIGKVYTKTTQQEIDEFDDTYRTYHTGTLATPTSKTAEGYDVYTVYEGTPIVDSDGNVAVAEMTTDSDGNVTWKTGGAQWDEYTQGYTDYVIQRYMDSSNDKNTLGIRDIFEDNEYDQLITSTEVTQVNRGQITVYPFYVNNDDMFDIDGKTTAQTKAAMDKTYSINLTHEQVYQCNMNGDDITVWYALAGGQYYDSATSTGIRNDCANAYYIYSRDNLIYTGAGHTNEFTEFEAKLFINTLCAAYEEPVTAPTFGYRNKYDTSSSRYNLILPTVDEDNNTTLKANDYIYFKLDDNNGSSKTLSVDFYYYDTDGETKIHLGANEVKLLVEQKDSEGNIIYTTENVNGKEVQVPLLKEATTDGNSTNITKLADSTLYAFAIPDSIMNKFKSDSSMTSLTLYAEPKVVVTKTSHVSKDNITPREEVQYGPVQQTEIRVLHLSDLS